MWCLDSMTLLHRKELTERPSRRPPRKKAKKATAGKSGTTKKTNKRKKVDRQKLQCSIDVFDHEIVVSRYPADGNVTRHLASSGDLAEMFGALGTRAGAGWMRITPAVLAVAVDADASRRWLVVRPARRTDIRVEVGKRIQRHRVHLPNLLAEWVCEIDKNGRTVWRDLAKLFAFAGHPAGLSAATILRAAPLPNSYSDGAVCMGSVRPERKEWRGLTAPEIFEQAWFATPFTDHALQGSLSDQAEKRYRNILDAYRQTGGRVPLTALRKIGTFGDLFPKIPKIPSGPGGAR